MGEQSRTNNQKDILPQVSFLGGPNSNIIFPVDKVRSSIWSLTEILIHFIALCVLLKLAKHLVYYEHGFVAENISSLLIHGSDLQPHGEMFGRSLAFKSRKRFCCSSSSILSSVCAIILVY